MMSQQVTGHIRDTATGKCCRCSIDLDQPHHSGCLSDGLSGSGAIVQHGLDAAKQTLFSAADVPLASVEELLAAVSGPALKAVLEMRIEQIVKHGHDADKDRMLPIGFLVGDAADRANSGKDCLFGDRRNLKVARRRLATAAALLLAAIDRLDFEAELEPKGEAQ